MFCGQRNNAGVDGFTLSCGVFKESNVDEVEFKLDYRLAG